MPICKREGFDLKSMQDSNDTFHDNDMVFCCYITKQIFRDYESFFRHVMVINSTVWQCEATGRENLTYEEALKSERTMRKKMEQFKPCLRGPALMVIQEAHQSTIKELDLIVSKFLRKRFFLNEEVSCVNKKNSQFIVVGIQQDKNVPEPANGVYENLDELQYRLRDVDSKKEIIVPFEQVKRPRTEFNLENLHMFIKNNALRDDGGIFRPKPDAYKKYVSDPKLTFSSIFIGKMPRYTPSKAKKVADSKSAKYYKRKQPTLNEYIVKGEEAKSLQEQMERVRREKQEQLLEQDRQKAEKKAQLMERVESECDRLLLVKDDLERNDQRLLPNFLPVVTILPEKLLGDCFMLREFMHSFAGMLSGVEVFRQNLSFYEMTRAMTAREVAGPLSDILLVLLGTVLDLQREEEEELAVQYLIGNGPKDLEPYRSMSNATRSHFFAERHFSLKIHELPLDALTISEVLRLHLLSSGAHASERNERWRVLYRNGYNSRQDPGLELRLQHSHILRALKNYSIYQFSFRDIMRVIRCLMAQILTYSGTINVIEERMELMVKTRVELRSLIAAENRRATAVEADKRRLTNEHHLECMTDELKNDVEKKQALNDKLNKRIAELLAQSDRERRKHESQVLSLRSKIFNCMIYLGMDRCYRKYYVLESMAGIFVEHPPDCMDTCLDQPPVNLSQADIRKQSKRPKYRKELRAYLIKIYSDEEKNNNSEASKPSQENKENQEHVVNGLSNGNDNENVAMDVDADVPPEANPTQYELRMCTGDKRNCFVHDERNPDRQRWSYIYKPEEIQALINALNPLGQRESKLRDDIISLRTLIEQHAKSCPTQLWTLEDSKRRRSFHQTMSQETNRQYGKANFGMPDNADLNEVMENHLVDRILEFERDIFEGNLGRLKVKDMSKWRNDFLKGNYDPQGKLQWGPNGDGPRFLNKDDDDVSENGSIAEEDNKNEEDESTAGQSTVKVVNKPYRDPGQFLGPTLEIDSEDSADDEVPLLESSQLQQQVRNAASALLQVEQAIERRFFKHPFGGSARETSKEKLEAKQRYGQARLKQWQLSLMESTSFSQVFLHLNILHDCIMWARSTKKSLCAICRRGSNPEKMLLCDECNGGTHMFCMKPKMKTVPEGNWYCKRCTKDLGLSNENGSDKKKKRRFIMKDEEGENEEEESQEEEEKAESSNSDSDSDGYEPDDGDETYVYGKDQVKKKRGPYQKTKANLKAKEIEQKKIKNKRKSIAEEEDVEDEDDDESGDVEKTEKEEEESDEEPEYKPIAKHLNGKVNGKSKSQRSAALRSDRRLKSKEIAEQLENENSDDDNDVASEAESDDRSQSAEENDDDDDEDEEVEESPDEEEDQNDEEAEEEEDLKNCNVCFDAGSELSCARCSEYYHMECLQLKRIPRTEFVCKKCKNPEPRRPRPRHRNADEGDDDDDDDEPQSKRSRTSRNSLRHSLQNGEVTDKSAGRHSINNNNSSNNNNNRRSGRRTNDNLPLNSAALYELLEQTIKHKAAWPFRRPVLTSEVPDYHKIVKTPMDLAKVKSKLNMGEYQINEELLNDVQLVFRNCDLYNVEGNEIYDAGRLLERFVIARCKDLHLPFKPSDMNAEAIC